jgi:uncharacterized RDD family membrane protein YckC
VSPSAAPPEQEKPVRTADAQQPAGDPGTPAPPSQPSAPPEQALGFKDDPSPAAGQPQPPAAGGELSFKDSPQQTTEAKTAACTGCLKLFNENELAQSGDRKLCQSCLDAFKEKGQTPAESSAAQRLAAPAAAKKGKFSYGGFWIRFGAALVDGVLLVMVWHFLISPIIMKAGMSMFSDTALPAAMSIPQDGSMDPAQMEAAMAQMQEAMNSVSNRMITWVWVTQLISLLFFGGYFILLEGGPGQTIGKKALGLRVVGPDGDSIGYLKAFARYVGKMISGLILCIGYIMAAFDSEKRALHDRMVDSRVVRE